MSMNTILREKRKELGFTQEQVAHCLGVSTPAVNKWEKGVTYPDVTLLPPLARLLKTDLNTLLCFNEELSEKEIGLFLNSVVDIFQKEGFEAAFATAMEKVREYPANAGLLNSLAMVLEGSLMTAKLTATQKESYHAEITTLYERVVSCGNSPYLDSANYILASKLIADEEYDKAQEILNELPNCTALDKRVLQANLWLKEGKNEDAGQLLEHKLLANLQDVQVTLSGLVKILLQEGDEEGAIRIAQCGQKEAELFGLWGYAALVIPLETAVLRRDVEGSLSILQDMLSALLIPWDMGNSPVCKHIHRKKTEVNFGEQFLPSVLSELDNSSEYDFLREEPAFEELLNRFR